MAESTAVAAKQAFARRVVQVDMEGVGKHELDTSQGVVRASVLAKDIGKTPGKIATPINTARVYQLALQVINL